VHSVSASTNASNRSSFAPEDTYRDRRFFTCRDEITTTVSPAASSASTRTPSLRSIATSRAPLLRSRETRAAIPALLWAAANRSFTRPAASTTQTACSAAAQSIPAVTPPGGTSGSTCIRAYFNTASSLLAQWGGTHVFTCETAGDGTGTQP
jgi:hypothetical protein